MSNLNDSTRFNGWANYATWRVKLELLDDIEYVRDLFSIGHSTNLVRLAEDIKDYVVELLYSENGLAQSYAEAFLWDVDWLEIANHVQTDVMDTLCKNCNNVTDDDYCCSSCKEEYRSYV